MRVAISRANGEQFSYRGNPFTARNVLNQWWALILQDKPEKAPEKLPMGFQVETTSEMEFADDEAEVA